MFAQCHSPAAPWDSNCFLGLSNATSRDVWGVGIRTTLICISLEQWSTVKFIRRRRIGTVPCKSTACDSCSGPREKLHSNLMYICRVCFCNTRISRRLYRRDSKRTCVTPNRTQLWRSTWRKTILVANDACWRRTPRQRHRTSAPTCLPLACHS